MMLRTSSFPEKKRGNGEKCLACCLAGGTSQRHAVPVVGHLRPTQTERKGGGGTGEGGKGMMRTFLSIVNSV